MIRIEITTEAISSKSDLEQIDEALNALGLMRAPPLQTVKPNGRFDTEKPLDVTSEMIRRHNEEQERRDKAEEDLLKAKQKYGLEEDADMLAKMRAVEPMPELSIRKPGEPSPGKKRRTKEEKAEDDAYFAKQPETPVIRQASVEA
jgi:hypothetical protein